MYTVGDPECLNNGSCYNGYCYCPPGYGGARCERGELSVSEDVVMVTCVEE